MNFLDKYKYLFISGAVFLILLMGSIISVGYVKYTDLNDGYNRRGKIIDDKNGTIAAMADDQKRQRAITQALDELADAQKANFGSVTSSINQLRANDAKVQALLDTRLPANLSSLLEGYYRTERPKLSSPKVSVSGQTQSGTD